MSSTVSTSPPRSSAGGPAAKGARLFAGSRKLIWLAVAIVCMLVIFFSGAVCRIIGGRTTGIGVLAFALIVWVSEAISYPMSAVAIFSFLP